MIARVWRGWTAPEDADRYERLLRTEVLPDIAAQSGDGFCGAAVYRRPDGGEVAFMTVLRFDSMEVVRQFVGENPSEAHVPPAARPLLRRFEDEVVHYEVVVDNRD